VVVADRQGRVLLGSVDTQILRLSVSALHQAKEELISEGLISYRRPYWEVKNLTQGESMEETIKQTSFIFGRPQTELLPDQDRTGISRKRASRYIEDPVGEERKERKERTFVWPLPSLIAEWFKSIRPQGQQVTVVRTRG